jgi:hypothetical protein
MTIKTIADLFAERLKIAHSIECFDVEVIFSHDTDLHFIFRTVIEREISGRTHYRGFVFKNGKTWNERCLASTLAVKTISMIDVDFNVSKPQLENPTDLFVGSFHSFSRYSNQNVNDATYTITIEPGQSILEIDLEFNFYCDLEELHDIVTKSNYELYSDKFHKILEQKIKQNE